MISALQIEQAETALHDAQARVRLAEKSLAVSASGEKQEMVTVTSSRITSLQKEIEFLENKRSKYVITAPFTGEVRFENTVEGERLLVEDTSALIVQIPIRLRDQQYLQLGQQIELHLLDRQTRAQATVLEIGKRVEVVSFEQVGTIKALVAQNHDQSATLFAPGAPVRCRIVCERVRVAEYLRRAIRWQL